MDFQTIFQTIDEDTSVRGRTQIGELEVDDELVRKMARKRIELNILASISETSTRMICETIERQSTMTREHQDRTAASILTKVQSMMLKSNQKLIDNLTAMMADYQTAHHTDDEQDDEQELPRKEAIPEPAPVLSKAQKRKQKKAKSKAAKAGKERYLPAPSQEKEQHHDTSPVKSRTVASARSEFTTRSADQTARLQQGQENVADLRKNLAAAQAKHKYITNSRPANSREAIEVADEILETEIAIKIATDAEAKWKNDTIDGHYFGDDCVPPLRTSFQDTEQGDDEYFENMQVFKQLHPRMTDDGPSDAEIAASARFAEYNRRIAAGEDVSEFMTYEESEHEDSDDDESDEEPLTVKSTTLPPPPPPPTTEQPEVTTDAPTTTAFAETFDVLKYSRTPLTGLSYLSPSLFERTGQTFSGLMQATLHSTVEAGSSTGVTERTLEQDRLMKKSEALSRYGFDDDDDDGSQD